MEPSKFSLEHIEEELITLTSQTLSSEYWFETQIQSKFVKHEQFFDQLGNLVGQIQNYDYLIVCAPLS